MISSLQLLRTQAASVRSEHKPLTSLPLSECVRKHRAPPHDELICAFAVHVLVSQVGGYSPTSTSLDRGRTVSVPLLRQSHSASSCTSLQLPVRVPEWDMTPPHEAGVCRSPANVRCQRHVGRRSADSSSTSGTFPAPARRREDGATCSRGQALCRCPSRSQTQEPRET